MRYTGEWSWAEVKHDGYRPSEIYLRQADDDDLRAILAAMQLLQAAGVPPDLTRGNPELQRVGKHKPKKAKRKYPIYVLKVKPSPWRLYFWVPHRGLIELLYVVAKKQDKRDP